LARAYPFVSPKPSQPAALYIVPGKSAGAQNVSARSTRWPCAASQSSESRRVISDRKREARFGNTPGAERIRNRVLFATISSRRNCCADRQPAEAEMVVPVHQRVPERALRRRRQPDLDPGQGEALGSLPIDRAAFHARAKRHAETVACQERERQRKVQNLPDARGGNPPMPSVKKNQTKSSAGSTWQ